MNRLLKKTALKWQVLQKKVLLLRKFDCRYINSEYESIYFGIAVFVALLGVRAVGTREKI